jgi:hypothetical protein
MNWTKFFNIIYFFNQKQNFGLRLQDLQAEKDKLLAETAEMLHSSIYTAEILLKKHCNFFFSIF